MAEPLLTLDDIRSVQDDGTVIHNPARVAARSRLAAGAPNHSVFVFDPVEEATIPDILRFATGGAAFSSLPADALDPYSTVAALVTAATVNPPDPAQARAALINFFIDAHVPWTATANLLTFWGPDQDDAAILHADTGSDEEKTEAGEVPAPEPSVPAAAASAADDPQSLSKRPRMVSFAVRASPCAQPLPFPRLPSFICTGGFVLDFDRHRMGPRGNVQLQVQD